MQPFASRTWYSYLPVCVCCCYLPVSVLPGYLAVYVCVSAQQPPRSTAAAREPLRFLKIKTKSNIRF
ncbi:hypothetical protein [Methanimicrococcus stummii]|uniref:hypothetical protein n=1 Tax=Methanimicrococcus stummii TaxID=3028294 RepID=UPI00292FE136|nr:hypothetical protein [Methanimicrococcus sp. Es2]